MTNHDLPVGLRRYRLKIFDGPYEVLHRANFIIDIDLSASTMNAILDRQLSTLTVRAKLANEPMTAPILKVCDYENGRTVLDWVA